MEILDEIKKVPMYYIGMLFMLCLVDVEIEGAE